MTIEQGDFDAVTLADLEELILSNVPEGLRLEYKRELYGNKDNDKREFLKDVSALANSHGGHLVIGISEKSGCADELVGVDCSDSDKEVLRMENLLRSGIEPTISSVRIRVLQLENTNNVFILRIPKSWYPPHRVIFGGLNRFFVRNSAGVHQPDVEELRTLFTQSSTALEQARQFRDERLASFFNGSQLRPLVGPGRLFIHIFPTAALSGLLNIDVQKIYDSHRAFSPLGSSGMSPRFNFYGVINETGGDQNYGYTQIFRNGCVEATKGNILVKSSSLKGIAGNALESYIFEALHSYICALRDLGVPAPLVFTFTFEGVAGQRYIVGKDMDGLLSLPNEPIIYLPECILEDYGDEIDTHRAVRPAFDALWNAAGHPRAGSFNGEGKWVGQTR